MAIFAYSDSGFTQSCWRRAKFDAISREAARRRIKCFSVSSRADLIRYEKIYKSEFSSLVLIPGTIKQLADFREMFKGLPLRTIVFAHHTEEFIDSDFSYVMSDYITVMEDMLTLLRRRGATRIALFGVTKASNHDTCRERVFRRFYPNGRVFYFADQASAHRTQDAIEELLACGETFDAIIACNDFIALSLTAVFDALDPDWNKKILLASYSDLLIGRVHSPALTSASLAEDTGGKEIDRIHRALERDPQISVLHALMRANIAVRETTAQKDPAGVCFAEASMTRDELRAALAPRVKLMRLELFLETADTLDLQLLCGIIENASKTRLAERLYLSADSIKYRLRKIRVFFGFESAAQLRDFLAFWVDPKKLADLSSGRKK